MNTIFSEPTILFEDEDLIVLNKPSGYTVNRSDTTASQTTMQDWVLNKFSIFNLACRQAGSQFSISEESDFYKRSGIVHRLDKETSGILLVAKTPKTFENLQKQFKERMVEKMYIALVHGSVIPKEGEVSVPVGRLGFNRKRFGIVAGGREAVTSYRTISNFKFQISNEQVTLLALYPKTGRTHQIRVHMKYLNHSVFSDMLYGGRKTSRNDRKVLPRLFLHASKISFLHPMKNERLSFESPLPQELQVVLDSLQ